MGSGVTIIADVQACSSYYRLRSTPILLAFALASAPRLSGAVDGELQVSTRGYAQTIPEEVLFSRLRTGPRTATTLAAEVASVQAHALGHLEHRLIPEVGLRLGLDTGLLEVIVSDAEDRLLVDGVDAETRFVETLFLGETYVDLQLGPSGVVEVRLGKLRPRIAAGAVLDAYGFGVDLDVDLSLLEASSPWSFRLLAFLPRATFADFSAKSPFVEVEASARLDPRLTVTWLLAGLWDGDDGAAPVLRDAIARGGIERLRATEDRLVGELPPRVRPAAERAFDRLSARVGRFAGAGDLYVVSTEGWLGWSGAMLDLRMPGLSLEAVALVGFGEVDVVVEPDRLYEVLALIDLGPLAERALAEQSAQGRVPLLSGLFQVTLRGRLFEDVDLELFALGLTGDTGLFPDEDGEDRYSSFVALAPLLTHTSLFFGGGIASSLASPTVASPAPDGAGLLAGGAFIDAYPGDTFHLRSGLAVMASLVESLATGGRVHGVEGNVLFDALLGEGLLAFVDLAVLVPMDYYGDLPPAFQAIGGLALRLDPTP